MECSFAPWEGKTVYPVDGDLVMDESRPPNLFSKDGSVITDQQGETETLQNEECHETENVLEVKMRDMMNLDTTGQDFINLEHACVDMATKAGEELQHCIEEPKMCNEETATYWTGGVAESQPNELLPPLHDRQLDPDEAIATTEEEIKPEQDDARIYLPLKKTLRNLRLLDLKLKFNSHQFSQDNPRLECSNDSSSSSDETDSVFPESTVKESNNYEEELAHNTGLIDLLTQCQHKLEQMEVLRHYSRQLSWSLWEAETTIEYLKEKVADLQRENVQKEEDIFFLIEELRKSKQLLQKKTEQAKEETTLKLQPSSHVEKRQIQYQFEPICIEDEHPEEKRHQTDPGSSKICIIL
ncbi:uncharacterized protein PAF06_000504 [Gastrophryne carolinensis]